MVRLHVPVQPDPWLELQARFGQGPRVLYVAGPLRGDGTPEAIRGNQLRMQARARLLQDLLPEAALVVPHCNFSFMDEAGPGGLAVRARVLAACERLLLRCDGLILCGQELTEGMAMERAAAIAAGLPIVQLPEAPRVVQAGRLPSTTVLLKSIQRLGVAASCDAASRRCSSSLGSQR